MRLVAFDPFKHLDYARSVLTVPISDSTGGIVAIDDNGVPQGVMLLDTWAENSVIGHTAIQHPMVLREMSEVLRYVFDTCDKGMLLGMIISNNKKSLRFHKHIGFTELYRIIDGYALGVDIVLVQLLRENCRYLNDLKEVA